jgi:hypothetical protein
MPGPRELKERHRRKSRNASRRHACEIEDLGEADSLNDSADQSLAPRTVTGPNWLEMRRRKAMPELLNVRSLKSSSTAKAGRCKRIDLHFELVHAHNIKLPREPDHHDAALHIRLR